MKKIIIRRAAALCASVIILASGCGNESGPAAVPDESTAEAIEKIQIEIEYDGDEVLGDAIRKAADGFNESQEIYVASVGSTGVNLQELAGDSQSAESQSEEAGGIESTESQSEEAGGIESAESQSEEAGGAESAESLTDEVGGTENADDLSGDSGQRVKSLTASVVFTDDNMAAAYASDYRRLDLRTCQGFTS